MEPVQILDEKEFNKNKNIVLLNLHNMAITSEARFSHELYNKEYDCSDYVVKNSVIALKCILLKRMEFIIENEIKCNEIGNQTLNKIIYVLDNDIKNDEDFIQLMATVLEYKYIHAFENITSELQKLKTWN